MNDDKIAEIRARHSRDDRWRNSPSMICPQAHNDRATLLAEVERLTRERDEARAEVERLRDEDTKTRHALRGWVWVCPDGGDEPTHERVSAVVAEVERLTEWQSINHSEQHKLGWSMTEFCEGKRDHLHEMWERPPSLDYGIAHIEAEIKRLRAENARLRARLKKRREPDTHPVEET